MNKKEIASMIDQTLLSATATKEQVSAFCKEAADFGFASVCINPVYVSLAHEILKGSATKVCTVIDFPLGASSLQSKTDQADIAITDGADELDFVINMGFVKSHDWKSLTQELTVIIKSVKEASLFGSSDDEAPRGEVLTKLILETCYLSDEEIVESCKCAKEAGFDFVKTSTGFAILKDKDGKLLPNGATVHAVKLMRETVGQDMGVKASGGVHNYTEAMAVIEAGANRIGASSGVEIVSGAE